MNATNIKSSMSQPVPHALYPVKDVAIELSGANTGAIPTKSDRAVEKKSRLYVIHNYHDRAKDPATTSMHVGASSQPLFPITLQRLLKDAEAEGFDQIISWASHGRCFLIHDPQQFVEQVMPRYFRQSKYTSFQRQLNLYGFNRLTHGPDKRGYYHEYFLRGKPVLCDFMARVKVKGTGVKAAGCPEEEPNLYLFPPLNK